MSTLGTLCLPYYLYTNLQSIIDMYALPLPPLRAQRGQQARVVARAQLGRVRRAQHGLAQQRRAARVPLRVRYVLRPAYLLWELSI